MNLSGDDTPWTTKQMRENSSKWTLEGDAKLLLYLQAFSNNLCEKTKIVKAKMDTMISTLDYTHIALANSTNRFHALQHSQFVESRVYEEDILTDSNTKDELIQQEQKIDPAVIAKQAVICGLKLMESEFIKIPFKTINQTEARYKYIAKDRYAIRPLPPRIGSKEFLSSLHACESESEGGFGSSRSRSPSIASSQSKSYSPSLGFSSHKADSPSVIKGNSSLLAHSSDDEDNMYTNINNKIITKPIDNSSAILSKSYEEHASIDDKTVKTHFNPRLQFGVLFNDGPPILDDINKSDKIIKNNLPQDDYEEDSDSYLDKKTQNALTSNKRSYIFHGQSDSKPKAVNLFDEEPPEIEENFDYPKYNASKVTNLFVDEDSDSNDLFVSTVKINNKNLDEKENQNEDFGIFSNEPPGIHDSSTKGLGAIKKITPKSKIKSIDNAKSLEDDLFVINKSKVNDITASEKLELFEDDEDDIQFGRNILTKSSPAAETSKQMALNLFDDEPTDFVPITNDSQNHNKSQNVNKKFSLFSDSDDEDIFASLIKNNATKLSKEEIKQETKSIFEDSNEQNKNIQYESDKKFNSSHRQTKILDLFEDEDDIFITKPAMKYNTTAKIGKSREDLQGKEIGSKLKETSTITKVTDATMKSVEKDIKETDQLNKSIKKEFYGNPIMQNPTSHKHNSKPIGDIFDTSNDEKLFQTDSKNSTSTMNSSHVPLRQNVNSESCDTNNKINDVKLNINQNKSSSIKTKIVGIFEDPIYRESNSNNLEGKTSSQDVKIHQSLNDDETKLRDTINEQKSNISEATRQSKLEERKKSLYEEAASNIALFEDEPPVDIFDDLVNSKKYSNINNNKRINLFDDDEDEPDFYQNLSKNDKYNAKEPFGIGIFDNEPPVDREFKSRNSMDSYIDYTSDEDLFTSGKNAFHQKQETVTNAVHHQNITKSKIENVFDSNFKTKTNEPKKLSNFSNFNINVSALLPGARPPSLTNKHVMQNDNFYDSNSVTPVLKQNEDLQKKLTVGNNGDGTIFEKSLTSKIENSCENINGALIGTGTLQNTAVKERAKIPQKRRPPSRRARQEALRKSIILENSDSELESVSIEENKIYGSNTMGTNEKTIICANSYSKSVDTLPKELSAFIIPPNEEETQVDNDKYLISNTKSDQTVFSKSDNSNSLDNESKSLSQIGLPSINKDGTDLLSPSTEEDDIFKIDKIAEDDTLKVNDYNNIFNDSDDDIDDLSSDFDYKASDLKHDDIKNNKEFNLFETSKARDNQLSSHSNLIEDDSESNSSFKQVERDIKSNVGLKPVPESLDITCGISHISSKSSISQDTNNSELSTDITQGSEKNFDNGCCDKSIRTCDLVDKLSTLAIDGSAEVLHSVSINKTSKDILFDSDLEDDLFTAKPMVISKNVQSVSQKGDAKPRSPLDTDGADSIFVDLQRTTNTNLKKGKMENLFSGTDDDDDLFKVKSIKISKSLTDKILSNSKKTAGLKSTSLFGDSDDDDDLFKISSGKYS